MFTTFTIFPIRHFQFNTDRRGLLHGIPVKWSRKHDVQAWIYSKRENEKCVATKNFDIFHESNFFFFCCVLLLLRFDVRERQWHSQFASCTNLTVRRGVVFSMWQRWQYYTALSKRLSFCRPNSAQVFVCAYSMDRRRQRSGVSKQNRKKAIFFIINVKLVERILFAVWRTRQE